jgi:CHAD domain-containing protein
MSSLLAVWAAGAEVYPIGGDPPGRAATRPIVEISDEWIGSAYRTSSQDGRAAADSDDLEHWHDLRKSLKRLRYMLDAFAGYHDASAVKSVRRQLRSLQDVLGTLQDIRMREELLVVLMDRMEDRAAVSTASAVLARLDGDLAVAQSRCLGAWAEFDTRATRDAVATLTAG